MKPFTLISAIALALAGLVHLVRAVLGWEILVNGVPIPVWVSVVACAGALLLAAMLWRENRATH